MTEDEQLRIFSKKLNFYIQQSGKQQKEISDALGFPATTFNTWCKGKVMPKMGKVQALADYFGVLKSDLLEEKDFPDIQSEFSYVCLKIAKSTSDSDKIFQRLIMEFQSWTPRRKEIFCEYLKEFNIIKKDGE